MPETLQDRLTTYLIDAHSIEEQSLQQLRTAPEIAEDEGLARVLQGHLTETEEHKRRIDVLHEKRGASRSRIKDAVMRAGGSGFVLFARSQVDTAGKLAAHALAYEALEWAAYDLLARTAERAGDSMTVRAVQGILQEERNAAARFAAAFDEALTAGLARSA